MTPTEFPEQTVVWAENQPPYLPLPAYSDSTQTISCWRLTWRERFTILFGGVLWLHQMNFGRPLQPQSPSVTSPFITSPSP